MIKEMMSPASGGKGKTTSQKSTLAGKGKKTTSKEFLGMLAESIRGELPRQKGKGGHPLLKQSTEDGKKPEAEKAGKDKKVDEEKASNDKAKGKDKNKSRSVESPGSAVPKQSLIDKINVTGKGTQAIVPEGEKDGVQKEKQAAKDVQAEDGQPVLSAKPGDEACAGGKKIADPVTEVPATGLKSGLKKELAVSPKQHDKAEKAEKPGDDSTQPLSGDKKDKVEVARLSQDRPAPDAIESVTGEETKVKNSRETAGKKTASELLPDRFGNTGDGSGDKAQRMTGKMKVEGVAQEKSAGSASILSGQTVGEPIGKNASGEVPAGENGIKVNSDYRAKPLVEDSPKEAQGYSSQVPGSTGSDHREGLKIPLRKMTAKDQHPNAVGEKVSIENIQTEEARKEKAKKRLPSFASRNNHSAKKAEMVSGLKAVPTLDVKKVDDVSKTDTDFKVDEDQWGWNDYSIDSAEIKDGESTDQQNAGRMKLGQIPVSNSVVRRKILPGLTQSVVKTAEKAKTGHKTWQKHSFVLDDGKKIHLSARKVQGVLQLKLGALHVDLRRLLHQHQHQIREHLEQECGTKIDLQFENRGEQDMSQFLGDSSSNGGPGGRNRRAGSEGASPKKVDRVLMRSVRRFGYNQMEWTA